MARKNLLPTYLSSPAWVDLCNAIDYVYGPLIDTPTDNLGKVREAWLFNGTTDTRSISGQLISQDDMDEFERTVLVRQLNNLGFSMRNPDGLTTKQLNRLVRQISVYWYSKGKQDLAHFLSYVLDTDITMTRMWTEDYVTFYPEGDPHIGTPIYDTSTVSPPDTKFIADLGNGAVSPPITEFNANPEVGPMPLDVQFTDESYGEIAPDLILGPAPLTVNFVDLSTVRTGGTWYPTTHTTVEVDLGSLPAEMDLKIFSELFADLANYPLVLYYIITTSDVLMHSEQGDYAPIALVDLTTDTEIIASFDLGPQDITPANNGGRFTPIGFTQIAGAGGQGFQYPPPVRADFTSDVQLGMAPLNVNFTDLSTGPHSAFGWYFTQTVAPEAVTQNPSFVFTQPGTYDVSLQVSGFFSMDYLEKPRYITVSPAHPAAMVRLLDRSTNQQIISSFPLIPADISSSRGGGGYTPIMPVAIQGHGGSGYVPPTYTPFASFTASVVSGVAPLSVTFTDQSTDLPTAWSWSFETPSIVNSTVQNPTFVFTQPGTYSVTLIATNAAGSSSLTKTSYITVADPLASAVVLYIPGQGINGGTVITEFDGYPVGTMGTPVTTSAQAVFGSSILLDSSSVLIVQNRPDLELTGMPFVLESFEYLTAFDADYVVADFDGGSKAQAWKIYIDTNGFPALYDRVTAATFVGNTAVPLNAWIRLGVVWDQTSLVFFVDTVASTPLAWTGPTPNGSEIHFGNVLV